jgi:hypothetical protein
MIGCPRCIEVRCSEAILLFLFCLAYQAHVKSTIDISCAARDKCMQSCLQTLMLSVVIMLVAEVYLILPPDTSSVALISLLLVRDVSTDQRIRSC